MHNHTLKQGSSYKNFVVTKSLAIKEINNRLVELTHKKTGAKVIHLVNDDTENLFSLSFRTYPHSSRGAAHILEHIVLCGSRKFPVKDPFFMMLRRSLHTFMNAMTGSDFTCYPAASQVEKDFYNLFDVYLDAVFYPLIKRESFLQEGHRREFSSPSNPDSPLVFKGVVYNEMKGSLNSPETRLWHLLMQKMFKDLPYAFNSGGDPSEIVTLTYEDLIKFHQTYYHPSRCLFFFYGNIPTEKHLDFIEERVLSHTKKIKELPFLKKQRRYLKPVYLEEYYPTVEKKNLESKCLLSFGYLTVSIKKPLDLLTLALIDQILMGTDASYLKSRILKSKLCQETESVIDFEMSEIPYVITCKGCLKESSSLLLDAIQNSLKEFIKKPPSADVIEAALHQIEFSRTEITHDHGPYGLILFFRSALAKQHGSHTEDGLLIHALFKDLRKKLENKKFIANFIRKHFLKNNHLVQAVLLPDPFLAEKEEQREGLILKKIAKKLSGKEKKEIIAQSLHLLKFQQEEKEQPLDCLPKLHVDDIPRSIKDYPIEERSKNAVKIFHRRCPTNEILYANLIFPVCNLNTEEMAYLPLFTLLLTEVGNRLRPYIENLEYMQKYIGAISAFPTTYTHIDKSKEAAPCIILQGKALQRNGKQLLCFLKELAEDVLFNEKERITQLILQKATILENSLSANAMKYAKSASYAPLHLAALLHENWFGFSFYNFLKNIAVSIHDNIDYVISMFNNLKSKLFLVQSAHLLLACDEEYFKRLEKEQFYGLSNLKSENYIPWKNPYVLKEPRSYRTESISSMVAFISRSFSSADFKDPDSPFLSIASHLFENKVLHTKIREEGGAYGSGAQFNSSWGIFSFTSYRDPNIKKTFAAFLLAVEEIAKSKFTDEDLESAKIVEIGHLDTPLSFETELLAGYHFLMTGKTTALRQKYRDAILSCKKSDVIKAVSKFLLNRKDHIDVIFAGKDLIEKKG